MWDQEVQTKIPSTMLKSRKLRRLEDDCGHCNYPTLRLALSLYEMMVNQD